jgi:DNA-binding XRE family transcriptional regulator
MKGHVRYMQMNDRIKILRKNYLDITQEEFATKIKISRSNLGSIEVGRINVTDRVVEDICTEFNVNEE